MPFIDLSILNQRQTPAFYADVFANRPAAGFVGRIFVSTDTYAFYRDNGTGWDLIGGPGTGTVTGSGAAGQVAFWSGSSLISGENNLWWDSTNNHFGINTNTPGTALDVHHDQSTVGILNQTVATNDTRIAFQNSGVAKWRVGNFYNLGSNDYAVNDATLNINRFTVKSSSGQTFVGDETTSSGLFVVNNSSGDAHIVALGATAPSIRVRNAGVGASLQFGLGLATTTNNFIQGATGGEFCIFNDSLTAQPILFGIKDAGLGNTQEAARISAARNFLVGTTTDAGQKLQVNGTAFFNNSVTSSVASGNGSFYINNGSLTNKNWTLIPNTNSGETDLLFFYTGTGASTKLTLSSTGAATFSSSITAGGQLALNAGFGTSTPAISIYNNTGASASNIAQLEFRVNNSFGGNEKIAFITALNPNAGANNGGALTFATSANGTSTTPTERMRIDQAGNVGFNTTSPTTYGLAGSHIENFGGANYCFINNNTNSVKSFFAANEPNLLAALFTFSNHPLTFGTNNTERGRFTNSGNLLIGTTTDAGYKLQVNGTSYLRTNADSVVDILTIYNQSATSAGLRQKFQNGFGDLAAIQVQQLNNGALADDGILEFQTASNSVLSTKMSIKNNGQINIASIATSSAGLVSGDIWSNAGVLTIVP